MSIVVSLVKMVPGSQSNLHWSGSLVAWQVSNRHNVVFNVMPCTCVCALVTGKNDSALDILPEPTSSVMLPTLLHMPNRLMPSATDEMFAVDVSLNV